jgi:hypothetical protein
MEVGEEKVEGCLVDESVSETANSAARVEDEQGVTREANRDAGGVSAEAKILGHGSGDRAANTPECQIKLRGHQEISLSGLECLDRERLSLSFAQFEREILGERTRDKMSAAVFCVDEKTAIQASGACPSVR